MIKNLLLTLIFIGINYSNSIFAQSKGIVRTDILYRNDSISYNFLPLEALKNNTLIVICPLYDLSKETLPSTGSKMHDKMFAMSYKRNEQDIIYWKKRLNKIMETYPYKYKVMLTNEYEEIKNRNEYPYLLVTRGETYTKTKTSQANQHGFSETKSSLTVLNHYILMDAVYYTLYHGPEEIKYHQSSLYGEALTSTLKLLEDYYNWNKK